MGYCLSKYTSVEWSALDKTCDVSRLAKKSSGRAAQADDGATLWVTVDGIKYTYAEGAAYGGTNTEEGFGAWASCAKVSKTRARSCLSRAPGTFPRTRSLLRAREVRRHMTDGADEFPC